MQRPKWLTGWGKGKNLFEASLIIDIPEIKVVEATFNHHTVFFAVGKPKQNEPAVSDEEAQSNEGKSSKEFVWKIFYDSTALPDFMPIGKVFDLMAGSVAISSGSPSSNENGTVFIASGKRPYKGNAPLLLDYNMAKIIEEARKRKQSEIIDDPSS